jgi:hypothetical protein
MTFILFLTNSYYLPLDVNIFCARLSSFGLWFQFVLYLFCTVSKCRSYTNKLLPKNRIIFYPPFASIAKNNAYLTLREGNNKRTHSQIIPKIEVRVLFFAYTLVCRDLWFQSFLCADLRRMPRRKPTRVILYLHRLFTFGLSFELIVDRSKTGPQGFFHPIHFGAQISCFLLR